jgi:hypothetical protein
MERPNDVPPQSEGKLKLNPALEAIAKLPGVRKIKAFLSNKEPPTTQTRLIEGIVCSVLAGLMLLLITL